MEPMTQTEATHRQEPALAKYQGNLQPKGFPPLPEGFVSETETFPGVDPSVQLFGVLHRPGKPAADSKTRPHRLLVLIHGYGEHGGRYLHYPHYLKSTYDSFYCLDLRGHGRSEGLRGHVERFDHYAGDVGLAIQRLQEKYGKQPGGLEIDLLGHSMGGLVVLRVAHLHAKLPVKNLIVSAPLLGIAVQVSPIKSVAAKLLSRVWGTLHMGNEIDAGLLSRDAEVGIAYRADRLVGYKGTPRWYVELMTAMTDTMARKDGVAWPMLFLIPTVDKIVDESCALRYYEGLTHRDKELKQYEGFYHEVFNEIGKEKVFEDVAQWVKRHSASS
jgi:lysophospholipase